MARDNPSLVIESEAARGSKTGLPLNAGRRRREIKPKLG